MYPKQELGRTQLPDTKKTGVELSRDGDRREREEVREGHNKGGTMTSKIPQG